MILNRFSGRKYSKWHVNQKNNEMPLTKDIFLASNFKLDF